MSAVILKKLTVQNLGSVDFFSCDFTEGLNILKSRSDDELVFVLRIVLNHKEIPPLPDGWVRVDTQIEAVVCVNEKTYLAVALPDVEQKSLTLRVNDKKNEDVTAEYLYLCSHCAEHDQSDIFDGDEHKIPLRFLQYANEDMYYAPRELAGQTEGLSEIKAFRAYLRSFIQNFKGETIRDGKQYEIVLEKNGRYGVKHKTDGAAPVVLSESEQTLFRYLCFLRTAEFWIGFEQLRNLHGLKKPLIIKDFLCRLDESIDVTPHLERTNQLKRQIIILSW